MKTECCKRPRIGLYTIGLKAYWDQFPDLRERLLFYGESIRERLSRFGEVSYFGLVDEPAAGREAGAYFRERQVDIIYVHCATYCTSASVLPVHQTCGAPLIILNLQPAAAMAYPTTGTGEWLANCGACPVPEIKNALDRAGIGSRIVNGLLGMETSHPGAAADEVTAHRPEAVRAWKEIGQYAAAAGVKRAMAASVFGFLGGNYPGMLDLYSDFTLLQKTFGLQVAPLELCELSACLEGVSRAETEEKLAEIGRVFRIEGASPSDQIAGAPDPEALLWAARMSCAEEKLAERAGMDALAYYYHGEGGNLYERMIAGIIVGNCLLTKAGVPCAGEGDLKTAVAMKIFDLLGAGGSFTEIVAADYDRDTILLGHDGPFHMAMTDDRPVLRGMRVFHGKSGQGVSVEAKIKPGPLTLFGVTQTADGQVKFVVSEAEAVAGETLYIGNTQTHVKFPVHVDEFYDGWFGQSPTHHCAMGLGHNAALLRKLADLWGIPVAVV